MITISLNEIKAYNPYETSWEELLRSFGKAKAEDERFPFSEIVKRIGLDDAIWAFRCLDDTTPAKLFAIAVAQDVVQLAGDEQIFDLVKTAHLYVHGEASDEEFRVARGAATSDAPWSVVWDTRVAATSDAARHVVWTATNDVVRYAANAASDTATSDAATSDAVTSDAAWITAWAAVWAATSDAARYAARYAANAAAWASAWAAAWAARDVPWAAAWATRATPWAARDAARTRQAEWLIAICDNYEN